MAGLSGYVHAADSVTGTLEVRLRLQSSCDFATGSMGNALLDFGRVAGSGPHDAVDSADSAKSFALIEVTCSSSGTGANAPVLTIDYGLHAKGAQRYLMNAHGERIAYDLYADPAHHVPLSLTQPLPLVASVPGVTTAIPVYGGVAHIGDPYAGLYTDVVWLTLSY
ncbi:spore coat protein U domain-containing protein [Rhodanobacter sp. L36]|uniref:spore coat protein U domain-containing protein n=1 Tax=Rhodanobacter sp. L36 TaxID=1747221 RepID=UPI00131A691E|nr:spore coat protein U domain-containing protein [Rhodanobacter sp. L36]